MTAGWPSARWRLGQRTQPRRAPRGRVPPGQPATHRARGSSEQWVATAPPCRLGTQAESDPWRYMRAPIVPFSSGAPVAHSVGVVRSFTPLGPVRKWPGRRLLLKRAFKDLRCGPAAGSGRGSESRRRRPVVGLARCPCRAQPWGPAGARASVRSRTLVRLAARSRPVSPSPPSCCPAGTVRRGFLQRAVMASPAVTSARSPRSWHLRG